MAILKKYQTGGIFHVTPDAPGKVFVQNGNEWSVMNEDGKTVPMVDPTGKRQARILKYGHKDPLLNTTTVKSLKSPNNSFYKDFQTTLKYHENSIGAGKQGNLNVPYKPDPNGGWVIGYGHEIKVGEDFNKGLTNQQVENLFQEDLASHTKMAKDVVDTFKGNKPGTFSKLPIETQNVLVDMAFSMGKNGLKKYEDFLSAVQNKNKSKMIANVGRGGVSKERTDWAIDSILKSKFK